MRGTDVRFSSRRNGSGAGCYREEAQMVVMEGQKVAEGGKRVQRVKLPGTAICSRFLAGILIGPTITRLA
jgi:hypothetical protein